MRSPRDLALALLLCACSGTHSSDAPPPPAPLDASAPVDAAPDAYTSLADRPCPANSTLDYESFGGPFVLTWCAGCHSSALPEGSRQNAPLTVNFDTVDDVRTHAARMWARAADGNATMPPAGGPPASERTKLGEWLACGAP